MIRGSVLPRSHHLLPSNSNGQGLDPWHRRQGCYPSLLQQCRSMEEFRQVHAQIVKLGQEGGDARHAGDLIAACALSDWGSMDYALSIFGWIEDPTSFELNTLIRGFVRRCDATAAILLYREMQDEGFIMPDNFTFTFLLKACAQIPAAREGVQIHGQVCKHGFFRSDVFVQNSLISMYGKCGEIEQSRAVFEEMGGAQRSVASWSALLAAHTRLGLWKECLGLYGRMKSEGRRADESTLVSVLSSCGHLGAMEVGRCAHGCLLRTAGELNSIVQTTLVDMYIKCGSLERGLRIFRGMDKKKKNLWTYSVVISGMAMYGLGENALWVFEEMLQRGLKPDETIYVGVLSACSRAGLLAEGRRWFDRMTVEHQITPTLQHYACLVDLMARAGKLEEAYDLIRGMPMEPNSIIWRCLLSACRVHRNLELGEVAGRKLLELDPGNAGDYLLMSNMYAQARRWEDAARIRTAMVDRGLPQVPGSSTVEAANGELHRFVSQDRSHPQSSRVHEMLYQMEWQLRFEGYSMNTSEVVSSDVDDEERRRILGGHSQKLAIAFGLISTVGPSPIRVVKNQRMCRDCHTYTKLISRVFDREIIVRERSRFHHFREGICSCGDYW